MFYNPEPKPVNTSEIHVSLIGPEKDGLFWFLFGMKNTVDVVTILLNGLVMLALLIDRKKSFAASFYVIMMVFMLTMIFSCISSMVYSVYSEGLGLQCEYVASWTTVIDIFSSYYSVILILLLGVNRLVVFTLPHLSAKLFTRSRIGLTLAATGVFMLGFAILIYKLAGAERTTDDDMGVQTDCVTNIDLLNNVNYVMYVLAMLSSLSYVRVLFHLRDQRGNVISGKTRALLDMAERSTLQQGTIILVIYLLALLSNLLLKLAPPYQRMHMTLIGIQDVISSAPQLTIPLSVIFCSQEMRQCCKTVLSTLSPIQSGTKSSGLDSPRNGSKTVTLLGNQGAMIVKIEK